MVGIKIISTGVDVDQNPTNAGQLLRWYQDRAIDDDHERLVLSDAWTLGFLMGTASASDGRLAAMENPFSLSELEKHRASQGL
jgi:hypothetical protein